MKAFKGTPNELNDWTQSEEWPIWRGHLLCDERGSHAPTQRKEKKNYCSISFFLKNLDGFIYSYL
ncbi:hypothetical protein ACE6H2_016240 [Prunus campanulata]